MKKLLFILCLSLLMFSCENEAESNDLKSGDDINAPVIASIETRDYLIVYNGNTPSKSETYEKEIEYYSGDVVIKSEKYNDRDEKLKTATYEYKDDLLEKTETFNHLTEDITVMIRDYEGDTLMEENVYRNQDLHYRDVYTYQSEKLYTKFKYDGQDQLISRAERRYIDGNEKHLSYKMYNAEDQLMSDIIILYDEKDRVISQEIIENGQTVLKVTSTYNDLDQEIFMTHEEDGILHPYEKTYDDFGNMLQIIDLDENKVSFDAIYTYDQYGNYITKEVYHNGALESYEERVIIYE